MCLHKKMSIRFEQINLIFGLDLILSIIEETQGTYPVMGKTKVRSLTSSSK